MKNKKIKDLQELLNNPDKVQEIGNRVIRQAIRQAILDKFQDTSKSNKQRRKSQVITYIEEGDFVPANFRDLPNIQTDKKGYATANWGDCWGDMSWGMDCYTDYMLYCSGDLLEKVSTPFNEPFKKLPLEEQFTKDEIKMLKELKII